MKTIGITGGVGCGKSTILDHIAANYNSKIIFADNLANELESPGHECYDEIVALLGPGILNSDKTINRAAMSSAIFADPGLLEAVNNIVHPAVKEHILKAIDDAGKAGGTDYFFVEAALLIQDGYDKILDELWYIYADPDVRRRRLKDSRGYSDEKIDNIMASQLPDDEYMKYCAHRIDNSHEKEDAFRQIDDILSDH